MEVSYRRELNRTQLILEVPGIREKDYQVYMLEENHPDGMLPVNVQGIGTKTQYKYDISGKISIRALYEKAGIQYAEICQIVTQLAQAIKNLQEYMLDANKVILEPEFIFYENETFWFCYYPAHTGNIHDAFRELSEYFVRQVDCEDRDGICLAYEPHRITSEENYCLEQAVKQVYMMEHIEEELPSETEEYEDIIEEREMGIGFLRSGRRLFDRLTEVSGWKK